MWHAAIFAMPSVTPRICVLPTDIFSPLRGIHPGIYWISGYGMQLNPHVIFT